MGIVGFFDGTPSFAAQICHPLEGICTRGGFEGLLGARNLVPLEGICTRGGFEGLLGAQNLVPLEGKTAQMARRSPRAQDRLPLERGFARYTGGSLNLRVKLD